jgi:prefoldin subunit 5
MSKYLKVEGHTSLVRDINSNAIVNTNASEYQIYMQRVRSREQQGDQIRNAVKEINTLKTELREIKNLIKELVK